MKYNIINSDVYAGLMNLKEQSIDVAVTSPPYWNQRDYGFEGQIGNEKTYQEYISKLVQIFSVLKTRLKKDGVFFLNVGDKYLSKYGKSPLAFIPFKLAYEMVQDGWYLNDIIIWYKPNHMPSSIKNRFTNSYEPVFVLSPSKKNIFTEYKKKHTDYSNILKINLQPTPYKHVAVYPEKLVEKLLELVKVKDNFSVLDPFAGSGTTLKVVKDFYPQASAYMIEYSKEYIDIIINRCQLKNNFVIKHYDFIPYHYTITNYSIDYSEQLSLFEKYPLYNSTNNPKKGFIKIVEDKNDYYKLLKEFENQSIRKKLFNNSVCFIGSKEYDLELIVKTSQLNEKGWVIRNLLVVENEKLWYPLFMIVDDNKSVDYLFQYEKLNIKPKSNNNKNWSEYNFKGYNVFDSISKNKREGIIVEVLENYNNDFPKYVIVQWRDGTFTKEFVIQNQDEINSNIKIKSTSPIILEEINSLIELNKEINYELIKNYNFNFAQNNFIKNYNGKFKDTVRKNWGASPGARASLENEYFSLQRLYSVDQKLVAAYLNQKRIEKGYSKSEFTKMFPQSYKHTVGHWLRSDFGGSIPTPEDWEKISEILDVDFNFTKYVCSTALKLQTVSNSKFKMPDDFINENFIPELKKLYE